MKIDIDIPDTQYADGLVAFGSHDAVRARATFHVINERETWTHAAAQVDITRKLKVADAFDKAAPEDTKAKIEAEASKPKVEPVIEVAEVK